MELFTFGIGHYTEKDVKEAARALTGWTVDEEGKFAELLYWSSEFYAHLCSVRRGFGAPTMQ